MKYGYGGIILAGVQRGGSFEFILYGWYLIHFFFAFKSYTVSVYDMMPFSSC